MDSKTYNSPTNKYPGTVSVYPTMVIKDGLVVNVAERECSYLSKDDAIDLAWSILEHYGVTDRPSAPLTVDDLVEVTSDSISGEDNRIGKIVKQDEIVEDYLIRSVDGNLMGWMHAENLARLTKEEFLKKASERTARFVGDNDA